MNQILSQGEVDALLAAVSDSDTETSEDKNVKSKFTGGDGNGKVVVSYDLTSQDRIIRGRLPQMDVIYEKFMRSFRISLSSALRKIATLNHTSTDFLKFGEFINTLPMPTCMSVLRFNSLRGSALFVIESKLAHALVDNFFGGADHPYTKIEGKDFTPIELQIIKKVVDLAILDLDSAWSSVEKIDCSFVRTEINPQFVGIVPPTDVVVSSTFDVELENANGTITIVVPYSTLEPIRKKLETGFQIESDQTDKKLWSGIIKEQLLDTEVDLKVNLGNSSITANELLNLKVGDVIPLDQNATWRIRSSNRGVKKFKTYYGIHHGTVAVQVTKSINKD